MKKTKRKKRTSKGEQSPLEKKIPKPLKCRLCPEMLKSVGSKLKHEKEVHNIRNFECGPCNLSFKNIKGIQSHNLFKHGRVRVKCKLCVKYSVTTTHQFMDHHRDEHPDHPEVDCFQCRQKVLGS